jgi:ABC-type uncharacterized transport system permease subunit
MLVRLEAVIIPLAIVLLVYAAVLALWRISIVDVAGVIGSQLASGEGVRRVFLSSMPILFPALGLTIVFQAGIWNIGAEGQLFLGMVGATWIALHMNAGSATIPLMMLVAMLFGALWAALPGLLRGILGVNEVLTTLMMNYVAAFLLNYLVEERWRDPRGYGFIKTREFGAEARIGMPGMIVLAAVLTATVFLLTRYTRIGFYLRVMGAGSRQAVYAGASPAKLTVVSMLLSGALAGVGGMVVVSGLTGMLMDAGRMSPGYGYTAIIAAWLAGLNPIATVASSLFLGLLTESGFALQSNLGLSVGAVMLLEGMLLLAAATARFLEEYEVRLG